MDGDNQRDLPGSSGDSQKRSFSSGYRQSLVYAFVILLFFVSGFSSLIYQVVWTRLLVFVFGSTTFATSTVLAVFMGGLALGSFLAGRVSDSIRRPFLWYGILEGVIGLWALLAPWLFDTAVPLYKIIWQFNHLSVIPFSLLRFAAATAILLLPTTCMGATLPLLSRFVTDSLSNVGNRVGTLYAVNTAGAVGGALTAGFYLLPGFGLHITTNIAALLNMLLCVAVAALSVRFEEGRDFFPQAAGGRQVSEQPAGSQKLPAVVRAVMVAFAISGAIAMIYEVGWTRTLLMVIGSTTYAFTVMLSTFLIGIFLGSLLVSRYVDRLRDPLCWLASVQLIISSSGLLSINVFNYVPYWNILINLSFLNNPSAALSVRFLLAALVLLPITLCLGAIFPLVVRICTRDLAVIGRSVGSLYSSNTLGAIGGAFLAGFVVVPALGAEKTLILASAANFLLGASLLLFVDSIGGQLKAVTIIAGLAVSTWAVSSGQIFDGLVLMSAQGQRRSYMANPVPASQFPSYESWRDSLHRDNKLVFWQDGACATVGVVNFNNQVLSLLTNGHVDASNQLDMANQILIAAYPMLVKPEARDIAVVGWGSGVTVGVAGLYRAAVTAIEIEPAVVDAGKMFHDVNLEPEKNPRVCLEVNDGRNYLLATDKKFDLVVSEPSNPWQAGVCNLFTREYFSVCKDRLKAGGIFTLWIQVAEVSTENLLRVLAALNSVYPYTLPILSDEGNLVVLASDRPISIDFASASKLVETPPLENEFRRSRIKNIEELLAHVVSSSEALAGFTQGVKGNSDDRNRLEYEVAKTYENEHFYRQNRQFLDANSASPWKAVDWGDLCPPDKAAVMARVASACLTLKYPLRALAWAQESYHLYKNPEALRVCGLAERTLGGKQAGIDRLDMALTLDPRHVPALLDRGQFFLGRGDIEKARADFEHVFAIEPDNSEARYYLGESYLKEFSHLGGLGQTERRQQVAKEILQWLLPLTANKACLSRHNDLLLSCGLAAQAAGRANQAESFLRAYLTFEKDDVYALRALGTLLFARENFIEATSCWQRSLQVGRKAHFAYIDECQADLQEGKDNQAAEALGKALELFPGDRQVVQSLTSLASRNASARQILRQSGLGE